MPFKPSMLPSVALGVALLCQGAFGQTPAEPLNSTLLKLTLDDALARARQYSQTVYTASAAALFAHEDAVQAKAALLPSVNGVSQFVYTQPNGSPSGVFIPNDGPRVYTEMANVHGDVLNPGKRAEYRKALAAEALAKARSDLAARGLVATVTQDYYGMVVAQRKAANAERSLAEARSFQDLSEKQERGGEAAKVDVVKARLQVRQRERDLVDAHAALDKARIGFAVILFPTYNQAFAVEDDLDRAVKLPPLDEIRGMAAKNSPDIRAAEAAVAQQNSAIAAARSGYLPTLSVDYFFGLQSNQLALHNPDGQNNVGSSVQASLNIPIFSWGANKSRVKQAELQLDQAKKDLSLAQRTLLSEMESFYVEAQAAGAQIASLGDSLALSEENLRLTRLRYTAGESSAQEVVDAQVTLVDARGAVADGMARYRLALANLQTLTGAF
jgi:outer membrane protein TolC